MCGIGGPRMLEIPSLKARDSKNLEVERVLRGRGRPSAPTQDLVF